MKEKLKFLLSYLKEHYPDEEYTITFGHAKKGDDKWYLFCTRQPKTGLASLTAPTWLCVDGDLDELADKMLVEITARVQGEVSDAVAKLEATQKVLMAKLEDLHQLKYTK